MAEMTSLQRVLAALQRRQPDRVPILEINVDQSIIEGIRPGMEYSEFCDDIGLDAICFFDMKGNVYDMVDEDKHIARDQWGALRRFTPATPHNPVPWEPAVKRPEDLKGLQHADPDLPTRYTAIEKAVKDYKGKRAVIATVMDPFNTVKDSIRGEVNLYLDMLQRPALVDELLGIAQEYHMRYVENCINLGVDVIWVTGDYAMTKGPMVSPMHTGRFLTPGLKQIVDYCHSRNIPCMKHTDGNIWPIFDLIVETGIDGIHPIDPTAGMDLGDAKRLYGDRVCLIGGVDCGATLSWGTREEVRQAVMDALRKAGDGGGYICASSNSIHAGVKPENYVEMVQTLHEVGAYPLDL